MRSRSWIVLPAALALVAASSASARETQGKTTQRAVRLVERTLVDTRGTPRRFLSDILNRDSVLLSFTFTGCQALCPIADLVMDEVAERLKGNNPGRVRLLTLTLDPLSDTPEALRRERAASLHPDRTFLTGRPDDVWAVLDGLGIEGGVRQDHELVFLLIGRDGRSIRTVSGLADAEELVSLATALR